MDIQDFYEKNFQRQVRLIQRILKYRRDQAEDVVQTAYVKVIDNLDKYDSSRASFNTWFNKIMFNELRNVQRQPHNLPLSENIEDDGLIPYEFVILQKEIPRVLNEKHQRILNLFYLSGYTGKEIENITGVSVSNVTTVCNRFKKDLKERYNVRI